MVMCYIFLGPCENSGMCINVRGVGGIVTNSECDCPPGWLGSVCSIGKILTILILHHSKSGFWPGAVLIMKKKQKKKKNKKKKQKQKKQQQTNKKQQQNNNKKKKKKKKKKKNSFVTILRILRNIFQTGFRR